MRTGSRQGDGAYSDSTQTAQISRDVVFNQILFTAGFSLTTGSFLSFFAGDLGAPRYVITWILALPELVGFLAISTPLLLQKVANKKSLFLGCSLWARVASLLIPATIFLPETVNRFGLLLYAIILTGIFQSIAYTAYLSWLSELFPERNWGKFFARRNMAKVGILIFIPFLGSLLRDKFRTNFEEEHCKLAAYAITFGIGNVLQLVSLIPLLKWKARSKEQKQRGVKFETREKPFITSGLNKSFICLILFSWWLSFFQGLTQTAFFLHSYRTLAVSLTNYYLLSGSMYGLQLVFSYRAGKKGDRSGYRNMLILSTAVISFAPLFWIASLDQNWFWLWGAYLLWGGFGVVNLSIQNLVLKLSPRENNSFPIALQRYGAGLIAGVAGLAGGFWLQEKIEAEEMVQLPWGEVGPFLFLFLLSFIGRLTAPLWLFGIKEKVTSEPDQINQKTI